MDRSADGITRVDLGELLALRVRAAKPHANPAPLRDPAAGAHVSALRGRGMDYAESRIYQSGDDARNIDWRRTARSGKWHTKLFQAEREQSLLLVVDTSATMRFGTRRRYKSVAAARAAAWLAWTSIRGGDRVGALAFGGVTAAIDPRSGTRGALAVLGALARWDRQSADAVADAGEPLSGALARARRMAARGSRVWLLSDGWCVDGGAGTALAKLASFTDLRVVVVEDALERSLAPSGAYVFETPSGRRRVNLGNATARTTFRDDLARGWHQLVGACDEESVPWATLSTTDEPDVALASLWHRRVRRHSR